MRVVKRARGAVVEAGDHGVGELDGGIVKLHAAAGEPAIDAGMDGEGVVVEGAGNTLGGRGAGGLRICDDVEERFVAVPCLGEQPAKGQQCKVACIIEAEDAGGFQIRPGRPSRSSRCKACGQ